MAATKDTQPNVKEGERKSAWEDGFKTLAYNQALMIRIGLSSHRLTEPTNEFFKSFVPYYNLSFLSINLIFCGVLICWNWPVLDLMLEPLLVIIAGLQSGGMFLSVGLQMKNVKILNLTIQNIVDDEAEDQGVTKLYWNVEQKCRKYTKIIGSYIILDQSLYMAAIVVSVCDMLNNDYDTSKWLLPWGVPFDTNNLSVFQWFMLWFTQCSFGLAYSTSTISVTSYFVCGCCYLTGLCDHFTYLIESIKTDLVSIQIEENPMKANERIQLIKMKLCKAIDVHSNIYEIFNIMAEINSGAILVLLLPNVIHVAITLYTIEHATMDWVLIVFHTVCTACSLFWPFIYCHFSTMTIERIASIGDNAYGADWYNYPPDLKKYIIMIIARSQEELCFSGFGFVSCTMEVLLDLFKASWSYYLIFRTLTEV